MKEQEAVIRQMILVTDGESNIGGDPISKAKEACQRGIVINTIGIVDGKMQRENPLDEVINIAKAGGGSYEFSYIDQLYETMQSLTYKTVNETLQSVVNKQLKVVLGHNLEEMAPFERSKILGHIDRFSEEVTIQCCLLMDCSGSMASKIHLARHSILDLIHSFQGRRGKVELAIVAFPGEGKEGYSVIHHFGEEDKNVKEKLYQMKPRGGTTTAIAIEEGIKLLEALRVGKQKNKQADYVEAYIG
ncbi:conserved hypothetical protein [Alkaliphilus metalliredigens QYMF]|uniref:VWFA domain-containing protein n=1 Tax=Alkaliphilus metalliredigens (strain QYMF) TaxID=293826 RepID=A6TWQ0_ALKMQ|nr:VWA domain-containing protein [Alkaliphilus metalliredigens]ABR50618.1 conserved hypothetical protein [Alkaliphilus metalliredigens QYMF]